MHCRESVRPLVGLASVSRLTVTREDRRRRWGTDDPIRPGEADRGGSFSRADRAGAVFYPTLGAAGCGGPGASPARSSRRQRGA